MKKIQKNKHSKGITLASLVIYIAVMMVVLALIIRVVSNFRSNIDEVTDVTFESEFEKLNIYMLTETQKSGNGVFKATENKLVFANGNTFEYRQKANSDYGEIYYNDIKICKNIDSCLFTKVDNTDTNKTTISVDITINDIEKNTNYVIPTWNEKLPADYQEVEYILFSTQKIDTGVIPNQNTKVELKFKALENDCGIYSSNSSSSLSTNFTAYLYSTGGNWRMGNKTTALNLNYNTVYTSIQDKNGVSINGTTYSYTSMNEFESTQNLFLGYNSKYYKGRIYYCKIWEDDVLIRDLIPCYRKSDGEIGFYDLENYEFYTKVGDVDFLKGGDILSVNSTKKEEYNDYMISSKIPKEYQEVEYISTKADTAYINTGVIPDDNFGLKLEIKTSDITTDRVILGTVETGGTDTKCWIGYINNKMYYGWNSTLPAAADRPTVTKDVYNVVELNFKNNRKFIVDGTIYGTQFPTLVNITKPFCLMGRNWGGTCAAREQTMKYAIFTSGGQITHHFIPCYRKSDGEIGLYDMVNEVFYTNQGTGDFLKGPNVY